jgi:hypothetical protein
LLFVIRFWLFVDAAKEKKIRKLKDKKIRQYVSAPLREI